MRTVIQDNDKQVLGGVLGAWDFRGISTNEYTHGSHLYPAVMNPHIARRLIRLYGKEASNILDPYCGSGTSLVEAKLAGLSADGFDLNPIARLMSKVKTENYDIGELDQFIRSITEKLDSIDLIGWTEAVDSSGFSAESIRTWFPDKTVQEISTFLDLINSHGASDEKCKLFGRIALSDCLRAVSIQRMNEWKNYRKKGWREEDINSNYMTLEPLFVQKMRSNFSGLRSFHDKLTQSLNLHSTEVRIYDTDSVKTSTFSSTPAGGYDMVVTSPPYGDSRTTVAYEEFSWLTNVWLGLDIRSPGNLGREMMGGTIIDGISKFGCRAIDSAIGNMDADSAYKNFSFYHDYLESIKNISQNVRKGGFVCYVVGNRTSGGELMRMDLFTRWGFEKNGFKRVGKIKKRKLSNTRMPGAIAVTGKGRKKILPTMSHEYIVVCKKS